MAKTALLVTIIFIIWLLKREVRRRPSLSSAVWIPSIFMMILGSRPLSDWLAGGGYGGPRSSNNPLDQLFFLFVLGGSLFIASRRGVNWGKVFFANLPLMVLYGYFICGILWSDDPGGSAVRIFKDLATICVIGLIYSEKEPLEAIRAVFMRSACVLFPLSLVFDRYFPNFAREFSPNGTMLLSGVTGQKNSLGEIIFLFGIFILWDYLEYPSKSRRGFLRKAPWDHALLFGIGIMLLVQSQSKTALVCLVIGGVIGMRQGKLASRPIGTAIYGAILSTPFLLFFTRSFGEVIQPIVAALGRDLTFTGRTNIWDRITAESVNPIFGCGYWNFWQGPRGRAISDQIDWAIPTAHCGYLDIYLDGGVLGLAALLLVLVAYGWRLIKQGQRVRFRVFGLGVLCSAIIYNLSESSFVRMGPLWFAVVLMMVNFPTTRRSAGTVVRSTTEELESSDRYPELMSAGSVGAR